MSVSTKLMLVAFAVMFGGCGLNAALKAGVGMTIASISLGLVVLVVAGVIGQIGRAKQGRII